MSILRLIAGDNFIAVNKDLIRQYGLEGAVVIGELASEYNYWEDKNGLTEDGFFYSTSENVERNTGLKEKRQREVVKMLEREGVIETALRGIPAKRHFKINEEAILRSLMRNNNPDAGGTSTAETAELERTNTPLKKNIVNNNKQKELNNNYIAEIVDFLNLQAGTKFRASSAETKKHINARLNEGFTLEDFKTVIAKKCAEWRGADMEQYLRPSTLFGTKFEAYLNAKQAARRTPATATTETINGKEYIKRDGKYYLVGGSNVAVDPFQTDDLPF